MQIGQLKSTIFVRFSEFCAMNNDIFILAKNMRNLELLAQSWGLSDTDEKCLFEKILTILRQKDSKKIKYVSLLVYVGDLGIYNIMFYCNISKSMRKRRAF